MKKNLLIVAPSYYPKRGGVEVHLENIVAQLKDQYSIQILVRYDRDFPAKQRIHGVHVYRLPASIKHPRSIWWFMTMLPRLLKTNIVHSHDFFPEWLYRLLSKKRWIHTFHGYEGFPVKQEAITARKSILQKADYTFAVGDFIEKWYGTHCNEVTYGAVEPYQGSIKNNKVIWDFAFIGRLAADTGFNAYFEAMKESTGARRFVVVGDGPLRRDAERFATQQDLPIEFVGMVDNVGDYIHQSSVVGVSGYLGILEAAIDKKRIVAYYETPIKEDYLRMHPIAPSMAICSTSSEILSQLGSIDNLNKRKIETAYNWARQQTWPALAKRYIHAYEGSK